MLNNAKSITLFEKRVHDFAYAHHLFRSDKKYVVALSGGADSVSLLLVMKALGFNIEAAHCNFNLRGEESNRDEKFCISLCVEQGIPLHVNMRLFTRKAWKWQLVIYATLILQVL